MPFDILGAVQQQAGRIVKRAWGDPFASLYRLTAPAKGGLFVLQSLSAAIEVGPLSAAALPSSRIAG